MTTTATAMATRMDMIIIIVMTTGTIITKAVKTTICARPMSMSSPTP
jgi:hypothetical protein